MVLAVAVGIPVGILMARSETVGRILRVWVNVFVSAPVSALVPLLMAVVGIGQTTVVVTVFLFAVFVIVLDTEVGVRAGQPVASSEMAVLLRGRAWRRSTGRSCSRPRCPKILAGLRLGAIRGVKGVRHRSAPDRDPRGGELFETYSQNFLFEEFWALVIVVFAFAYVVSEAVARVERRVEHYARAR